MNAYHKSLQYKFKRICKQKKIKLSFDSKKKRIRYSFKIPKEGKDAKAKYSKANYCLLFDYDMDLHSDKLIDSIIHDFDQRPTYLRGVSFGVRLENNEFVVYEYDEDLNESSSF